MASESFWPQYSATMSATGSAAGYVSVTSTSGLYVRQQITLSGATSLTGVVKEVISSTQFRFGPDDGNYPGTATSVLSFVAGDKVFAPYQPIVYHNNNGAINVSYECEPTKAIRVFTVDPQGNYIDPSGASTPLSVTSTNSTSAATFQFIKVAAASITAGNASITQAFNAGTITSAARIFGVVSSLNSATGMSLNGVQVFEFNQGEAYTDDLAEANRVINASTTIGLWNVSVSSSSGSIRFHIVN